MGPTTFEVLMLALVNEEREAHGLQRLAHGATLGHAAEDHSRWMNDSGRFTHAGRDGLSHAERMKAAGYELRGRWAAAENIAWASLEGDDGHADEVARLHETLMASAKHRANILDADMREIGIGLEIGAFRGAQGAMVTQVFGRTGDDVFLTGLTTQDLDKDDRYDIGEGRGGITVTATAANGATFSTVSGAAGDYALALSAGTYEVTFTKRGMESVTETVTIGEENVGLDMATADVTGFYERVRHDTDDRFSWERITSTYDANDTLVRRARLNDNGDEGIAEYEDGVLVAYTLVDGSETRNFASHLKQYQDGKVVRRELVEDDGDIRSYDYEDGVLTTFSFTDVSDARAWQRFERSFDFEGTVIGLSITEDDGDLRDYDYMNGQLIRSTFTDGSGARSWFSSENAYNPDRSLDSRFLIEDDGDTRFYDFEDGVVRFYEFEDVSDARSWQTLTIEYDENGVETSRIYVPDDYV